MYLNQVTLPSANLARAVSFYTLLGLRLIVDSLPRYARLECPDGGTTLSLHHSETLPAGPGIVLYFECADLDAEVARLQAAGIAFETPPQDQPWLWREASLHDPDGHTLILYHAGENRRFPPWRVS
jgi:catechol 2,3-dioxygenase-like lactoylglutathione lyase family enzyme